MNVGQWATRALIDVVALAVVLVVINVVARRLLGLWIGKLRATLAAVVAMGAEFSFESQVVWREPSRMFVFIPIQIGVTVLVAITFLVVAEIVVPSGSWPRPDKWIGAVRGGFARSRRYSQISRIAVRQGLFATRFGQSGPIDVGQAQHSRKARALRLALQDAGVTFVKLGQLLSTRRDLLPGEYIVELSHLQERVAPVAWEQIEAVLTEELGAHPTEIFAALSTESLAAASIGRVHRARLHDGTEVVVKVQRPGIRSVVVGDLDIAMRLARTLEATTGWGRSLRVTELAKGFATAILQELDYRVEATNMAALRGAAATHSAPSDVVIPREFPQLCTERVLVMEFLPGSTLSDRTAVQRRPAEQLAADAHVLFDCLLRQVMVDGVFHADPHPGNIMFLQDGRLALIDFGSVGRLDPGLRAGLQSVFLAVDRGDPEAMSDALLDLVVRPDYIDEPALRRALGRFMAENLGAGAAPSLEMFTDLIRLVTDHGLAVPTELADAFRAFAIMEGALSSLVPTFDVVAQSRAFAATQVRSRLEPAALRDAVTDELTLTLPLLRRLPRHLDRISTALDEGRLGVNVRLLADPRDRRFLTGLVHLALLTFLAGTSGLMATLLLANTSGPALTPTMGLFQLFGYILIVISALLVLRVVFDIFRRHRPG